MANKTQLCALIIIVLIAHTLQMFNGDDPELLPTEGQTEMTEVEM